jgi:amidase
MPADLELHWWNARDLGAAIRDRRLSSVEVVGCFLDRIEKLDSQLNAFLHLVPRSEALDRARAADEAVARGDRLGPLHGLPTAIKDLMDVEGMPTTSGTSVHREIAAADCLLAEKIRKAGGIIIGKTNTPVHGLGTLTFNDLGGPTRNPWDRSRHAGGSSGGAAAAVAAGMLPFADGSDSGGSLRYPASFCNIIGLRPSPGRVPTGRVANGWAPHAVLGPMARDARDAGMLLAAIAGEDWRAPLSLQGDPMVYARIEPADLRGVRIAWSSTVGGLPVDPQVTQVLRTTRAQLLDLGCIVEDVELDLQEADRAWEIIEFQDFAAACSEEVETFGDKLRPDLIENVCIGRALTVEQIAWAETVRTNLFRRTAKLFQSYDLIAAPAAPVVAPPVECEWVRTIDGVQMERYYCWQRIACRITMTAHPALSMPAGFSEQGLPIGLQLVGRYRDELSLLRYASAFDDAAGFTRRRPGDIA